MRILIKIIFVLGGIGLMGGGSWVSAVGIAHSNGEEVLTPRFELPLKKHVFPNVFAFVRDSRDALKKIHPEFRQHLSIPEYGMAIPLGGGGALAAFIGLILFLNGVFRFKAPVQEESSQTDPYTVSDDIISSMRQEEPASGGEDGEGAEKISIDDSFLNEQEDSIADKLRDIGYLVQLAQGDLDSETALGTVQMFRPDLVKYLDMFEGKSTMQLALQIINSVILRHHRTKEDITADQFKVQDDRINECERATFARRYLPARNKITSDDMRAAVGKVYEVNEQAVIQKKFTGEAEDWADVSLRNAKEILTAKTSLDTAA